MKPELLKITMREAIAAAAAVFVRMGVKQWAVHAFPGLGDDGFTAHGQVEGISPDDLGSALIDAGHGLLSGDVQPEEVK